MFVNTVDWILPLVGLQPMSLEGVEEHAHEVHCPALLQEEPAETPAERRLAFDVISSDPN